MDGLNIGPTLNSKKLYRMLNPEERLLYEEILEDIGKNQDFYTTSSPEEITDHLINKCDFPSEKIYNLFKKINSSSREWSLNDRL